MHKAAAAAIAVAAVAAALASVWLPYAPSPPLPEEVSMTPLVPGLVTAGLAGNNSFTDISSLLKQSPRAVPYLVSGQGIIASSLPQWVVTPTPSSGEPLVRVAWPYAVYVVNSSLYLLRLEPVEEAGIVGEVDLQAAVKEAMKELGISPEWAPLRVRAADVLVSNEVAAVIVTYTPQASGTIECIEPVTQNITVGGETLALTRIGCVPKVRGYGTAAIIVGIGDDGAEVRAVHVFEGLAPMGSGIDGGRAYIFLRPITWSLTGEEAVDGVPLPQAGPYYVVAESGAGNSLIASVAISLSTGEAGVTNLVLPATDVMRMRAVLMNGSAAYLLMGSAPLISEEGLAEGAASCAPMAPDGLREAMESMGPNPSPEEVLKAIKEWAEAVQEEVAPLVRWAEAVSGGDATKLREARPPTTYLETVERASKEIRQMDAFIACAGAQAGVPAAETTRVVKVLFDGLSARPGPQAVIPGSVSGDSTALLRDYLYIVTYVVPGMLRFIAPPPVIIYPRIPAGVEDAAAEEEVRKLTAVWEAESILITMERVKAAKGLADVVRAEPSASDAGEASLTVLTASDLRPLTTVPGLGAGAGNARVSLVGNRLYIMAAGTQPSLAIVDVTNPATPELVAEWSSPPYITGLYVLGEDTLLGIGAANHTLVVEAYDVTDPASIKAAGRAVCEGTYPRIKGWSPAYVVGDDAVAVPAYSPGKGEGLAVFWVSPPIGVRCLGFIPVEGVVAAFGEGGVIYAFGSSEAVAARLPGLSPLIRVVLGG